MFPVEYNSYAAGDAPLLTTRPDGSHEFKIIDHLGGTRMVLSDNATRLTQTDYAPFGKATWSSGVDERLGWIGKENDNESNLGDFGVRKYDEELGRFLSCDPLWELYPNLTAYQYSVNSPLRLLDRGGKVVQAADATSQSYVRGSVETRYEKSVRFVDGKVDVEYLRDGIKGASPTSNAAMLLSIAENPMTVVVSSAATFQTKRRDGTLQDNMWYLGWNTGTGGGISSDIGGFTIPPFYESNEIGDTPMGVSVDGNINVFINPATKGQSQTHDQKTAHELYTHTYLYMLRQYQKETGQKIDFYPWHIWYKDKFGEYEANKKLQALQQRVEKQAEE